MRGNTTIDEVSAFNPADVNTMLGGAALAASRPSPAQTFIGLAQYLQVGPPSSNNIYNMPIMQAVTQVPQPNITKMNRIRSKNILGTAQSPWGGIA